MILYDFFSQKNACLELVDFETINIRNKKNIKNRVLYSRDKLTP